MSGRTAPVSTSWRDGVMSCACWVSLFLAAGMYATVVLSPKLVAYLTLEREYRTNQWKLADLDRQVRHLEKLIAAQTSDPSFVQEQAKTAFEVTGSREQRIPVESHLHLKIESGVPAPAAPAPTLPWYAPLLALVARSRSIENLLLAGAAGLVLCAFTLFRDQRGTTGA